jgi:gamma-glutamyltranspeptidase
LLNTPRARRGMVTAPHHLASEAGLRVLREGGNAIEATVAMAAALAVVYPHMTSIGGDGFWLIAPPGQPVTAKPLSACQTASSSTRDSGSRPPWRADSSRAAPQPEMVPATVLAASGPRPGIASTLRSR